MDRLSFSGMLEQYTKSLMVFCLCLFANNVLAEKLTITQVSASPKIISAAEASVNIRFNINMPGQVVVKVFDAMDALVWRSDALSLPAGVHAIDWAGRNNQGSIVPPEAYFFVIEAREEIDKNGNKNNNTENEIIKYDLTDITGGENLQLEHIHYNSETKKLTFVAPKTGRYNFRAGIARSFAIDTLINNRVVVEGEHEITWDGYDTSHVFNSAKHPNLIFGGLGYQLSSNAIVVVPPDEQSSSYYRVPTLISQSGSSELRENKKVMRANTAPNYYRSVNQSRDVPLVVTLPKLIKRTKDDAYIIQQSTPIRIDLKPEDIMVMEAQRGEIVLFLDGQLIHDNEVSYYPYTFNWDPKIYDGNAHLLTVFVAGFAGNIGMSTIKVQLTPL